VAVVIVMLVIPQGQSVGKQEPSLSRAARPDGLGYTAAFDRELAQIGQITPEEFARRFPTKAAYVPGLSWDPTTAKYWDEFKRDPATLRIPAKTMRPDFRLNADERAVFKRNGFVVSERLGADSFAEIFYRIYSRDLPVYVSSDAVLHAWHRSYDAILEEIEETCLSAMLDGILAGMSDGLPEAQRRYGAGVLADSVTDADYFLAVARSLLAGQPVPSRLGQDRRVEATLRACAAEQLEEFQLFGRKRHTDFSQFKPRGHYDSSDRLRHYFRAMMWCGRIDLRVAGNAEEASPRELGSAVVLYDLLERSGRHDDWQQFDRLLQLFVGKTDSMTFAQLGPILRQAGIRSPADVRDLDVLSKLEAEILAGKAGGQEIRGDVYVSPFGPDQIQLPRSFTVLGQKFVLDTWALSKVVYDDIIWEVGDVRTEADKVQRRVPSGLDVAFAVLGNDQMVPELVGRMQSQAGRKFRDGLNYQHNLAAVRRVIDAQKDAAWDENLYTGWLACLRELSVPTTDAKYPEAMRTRAWAMKSLNTQLASWSQLRHDTVLYVKQSYTGVPLCFYPAGYVELVPHFWARLEKMSTRAADLIEKTPSPVARDLRVRQVMFLRNFARQVAVLKAIAVKELAQQPLSPAELKVLKEVIQTEKEGSGSTRYGGWYPRLFYRGPKDSGVWDAVVADIHTDPPAPPVGDPGCVLHQGVGNVDLLLIAVDSGPDRMVYAGPVLSHYEFEVSGVARKSDREWRANIRAGRLPPRPEWTRSYLVPGENKDAKEYQHPDDGYRPRTPLPPPGRR
jgi:hypothetical protein